MSCEKDDTSVVDPSLSFPSILSAYVTPNSFDTTIVNSVIGATVSSALPVSSVTARVLNPSNVLLATIELKDDGVAPDTTAGDGKYAAAMNFTQDCRLVGPYKVEIVALNTAGLSSNVYDAGFRVINTHNVPPVVSGFFVTPHDVTSGQGGTFIIFWTRANDLDGSCDINRVRVTGTKPDNNAITPFDLFDDGNLSVSGDTTASDEHFTRVAFGDPPQLGYFHYFVRAYDNTGDSSNVLTDSIFVHQ